MEVTYTVDKVDKLDNILRVKLNMSRRVVKSCEKDIMVNNWHKNRNEIVNTGDIIRIVLKEEIPEDKKFINKYKCIDKKLDILYEDEYILVVNKLSNMPVHPSMANYENTLSNIVAPYLAKQNIYGIHIITRLDKDTSGICIFAKHPYIQEIFNIQKEKLKLIKEYICIVSGIVVKEHGIIEEPIARKDNSIILREVNKNGQYARTEFFLEKVNNDKNYSVLKVLLHTGRTHQIRVHMSYIGHTLLGDDLYAKDNEKKDIIKYITRQALHCSMLSFIHPITNKKVIIKAKMPEDLKSFM